MFKEPGRDHHLPVDLDDPWSVEAWLDIVRGEISLTEAFPIQRSAVRSSDGPFHHQIVLPFFGEPLVEDATVIPSLGEPSFEALAPGAGVVVVAIAGDAADLVTIAFALVDALDLETIERWFFRFRAVPEAKLELVLFGNDDLLHGSSIPVATRELNQRLGDRSLFRVELDTYYRDLARYGGASGMVVSERLFWHSSLVARATHEAAPVEHEDATLGAVISTVRSLREWLDCADLTVAEELSILRRAAAKLDPSADKNQTRIWAGTLYRGARSALVRNGTVPGFGVEQTAALRSELQELRRMFAGAPETSSLLIGEHLHAHAERILLEWTSQPSLEAACFHVLAKWIDSDVARAKQR
jgi:thiopeptide-type bacteriocin biosynthesis protein